MIFVFDKFELDTARGELRCDGVVRHVEPQVFALIELLVSNNHRIVTKDEINEVVWKGRIVSEAVVNSRIRSARIALDDSGRNQRIIKTHSRKGFRALSEVELVRDPATNAALVADKSSELAKKRPDSGKPSIAIMPFQLQGDQPNQQLLATAIPHELITELSRLRWLRVISRNSSFQFDSATKTAPLVGQELGVKYCLFGIIECTLGKTTMHIEVANTQDGSIAWSESFSGNSEDIQELRQSVVNRVTSQLDIYVPLNEANAAKAQIVENLDAWGIYHIGLQHLYRVSSAEIQNAVHCFKKAVELNPDFSLAYAGLAMTECAKAFGGADAEYALHSGQAIAFATKSLELDPTDPFGNLAMGRAKYVKGDISGSADWFNTALMVRPNYALALYSVSATDGLFGEGEIGQKNVDAAMLISPLDPYFSTMLTCRCVSHLVRGQYAEACIWADKIMNAVNVNPRFLLAVAASYALADKGEKAGSAIEILKATSPEIGQTALFRNFPFKDQAFRQTIYSALKKHGF